MHRQRIANLSVPFRMIVGMQGLPLIDPETATGAARAQFTAARHCSAYRSVRSGSIYDCRKESPSMNLPAARTPEQRKLDSLHRLEHDVDAWVATADPGSGEPYMVPLSFLWDGATLLIATDAASVTARNLRATGKVRLGVGPTRDVILIEGTAQPLRLSAVSTETADAFAAKTDFDPRELSTPYLYFRIRPQRVRSWREVNELKGRELMSGGHWHVS
jgi:hypothetical protein